MMPKLIEVPVEGQPQDAISDGPPFALQVADLIPDDTPDARVSVGIVDGRMWPHPEFRDSVGADPDDIVRAQSELDVNPADGLLDRQAGHATFIAGLVLQQDPRARVRLDHALNTFGTGDFDAVAGAVRALVTRHGVKVVNLSLGSRDHRAEWTGLIDELATDLPDVVVVAAAGNLARDSSGYREQPFPFYPAALAVDRPSVVCAAGLRAVDVDGRRTWQPAEFTNCGPADTFAAPAADVESTFVEFDNPSGPGFTGYARWSGTSFAAAVVSGQIAATMRERGLSAPAAVAHLRKDPELPVVTVGGRDVPLLGRHTAIWRPTVRAAGSERVTGSGSSD